MFGLFKRSDTVTDDVITFLNQVDAEYMRVFNTKLVNKSLSPFMNRECLVKVSKRVFSFTERYFGSAKFRTTKWVLLSCTDGVSVFRKSVVFDKIKVGGDLCINAAENYEELWKVKVDTMPYMVFDISEVQNV